MPGEYIENPRRAPRIPSHCDARVAVRGGGFFEGGTVDLGPSGCQLPTPAPLTPGARVFLELTTSQTPLPFHLSGRVAWAKAEPSPRAGIAFDEGSASPGAALYDQVSRADPAMAEQARAPDRIAVATALAPAAPKAPVPPVSQEELVVLGALGAGLTAGELRSKLGPQWDATVNALFALLARGIVVAGPPDADAAGQWKKLLLLR